MRRFIFLVVWITATTTANAQEYWIGKPTIGDYVHRDVKAVISAHQNLVGAKAEFNTKIAAARKAFLATAAKPAERAKVTKHFADLLFIKDYTNLSFYIFDGITPQNVRRIELLDAVSGGPVDAGIPRAAWSRFEDWVNGVRSSLGATHLDSQVWLVGADSLNRTERALAANEALYLQYKKVRDFEEIRRFDKEFGRVPAEGGVSADGSLRYNTHEVKPLDPRFDLKRPEGRNLDWELQKMLIRARESGQMILHCSYGPMLTADGKIDFAKYEYWFKAAPTDIEAMLQNDLRGDAKGSLQFLGMKGLENCPTSERAAMTIRKTAIAAHPLTTMSPAQRLEIERAEAEQEKKEKCEQIARSLDFRLATDPEAKKNPEYTKRFFANMARKEGCAVEQTGDTSPNPNLREGTPTGRPQKTNDYECTSLLRQIERGRAVANPSPSLLNTLKAHEDRYARLGCKPN